MTKSKHLDTQHRILAENLRGCRYLAGLSLREAAEEIGYSHAYLAKVELAQISNPSKDFLVRLEACYGLPKSSILRMAGYGRTRKGLAEKKPKATALGSKRIRDLTPMQRWAVRRALDFVH